MRTKIVVMVKAARVAELIAAGLMAGGLVAASIIVAGAGIFWLYVFGDDPWPPPAETLLAGAAYAVGAITAVAVPVVIARRRNNISV